jgi:hypothetical protein
MTRSRPYKKDDYDEPQTPLARVLGSPQVTDANKAKLRQQKARLNPFALKQQVARELKAINSIRSPRL